MTIKISTVITTLLYYSAYCFDLDVRVSVLDLPNIFLIFFARAIIIKMMLRRLEILITSIGSNNNIYYACAYYYVKQ